MTRCVVIVFCFSLLIGIVTADTGCSKEESNSNDETIVSSEYAESSFKQESSSFSETNSFSEHKSSFVDVQEPKSECQDDDEVPGTTEAPTSTTQACELTCGANEVVDDCPSDCPSDRCPKNEAESKSTKCKVYKKCPPPACKCRFNYRRAKNGTCIPTRSCPPFKCNGKNEEFNPCPPFCPSDDCSQASPNGECPRKFGNILIVLPCSPKCRCKKGFWRRNGICVPYAECSTPTCGENEVLDECPANCPENCPKSDEEETETKPCVKPDPCPPPACKCAPNYLRAKNGTCIPETSCPFLCGPNERHISEKSSCTRETCFAMRARYACINETVAPGCVCKSGFKRLEEKSPCVPKCQCKELRNSPECLKESEASLCGPNEMHISNKSSCTQETCFSTRARYSCINETLAPGCVCKPGFLRLKENSPCVPQCQCEELKNSPECLKECEASLCGPNEMHISNKSSCTQETCFSTRARYACINETLAPGCVCESGFLRLEDNSPCVPQCQCEELKNSPECLKESEVNTCTGPYEEFVMEKVSCPPQECRALTQKITCTDAPPLAPGCVCISGYTRLNETSSCVPLCECPEMLYSPECIGYVWGI